MGSLVVLRVFGGLVLAFLGMMQARVTWRGLWGLSLTRRCRWAGYVLALLLAFVGTLAAVSPLPTVALCALPAALLAMVVLVLLSSWINRDMQPPDVRRPGKDDPWSCQTVTFADGAAQTPALWLKPKHPGGGTVCWVHGGGDSKALFKWVLVRALTRRGMAVLTFDLPGHGDHPLRFSLPEALTALSAALAYLTHRPDVDGERIGVMGVSLGGALTIRSLSGCGMGTSSPALPKAICLLETPCSLYLGKWLRLREALGMATLQALDILRDTSVANLLRLYRARPRPRFAESVQWVFDDLAPAKTIAGMPSLPLLIVSGGRDPIAPQEHGERLCERAKEPKECRIVRAGSHFTLIFLAETAELVGKWFAKQLQSGFSEV
jgi:alpha-beta hydrolase superfamily lysophospholipase